MQISDAEKIATIYQSFRNGTPRGLFGEAVELSDVAIRCPAGTVRVSVAGGPVVFVRVDKGQWHVTFKSIVGVGNDLELAARLVLEAGHKVNATKASFS